MNSNKSFFNKSIVISDLKRLWWVLALGALFIFALAAVPIINTENFSHFVGIGDYTQSLLFNRSYGAICAVFIFPVGAAMLLFRYLTVSRSAATMHAFPVTRATLYRSHLLSGFILLYGAVLLNTAALFLIKLLDVGVCIAPHHILLWTLTQLIYQSVVFAAASFIAMTTASSIASVAFTYIFIALPAFFEASIDLISRSQLYGYSHYYNYPLSNIIYATPHEIFENLHFLSPVIITITLLILGYVLYSMRRLERAGDIMVFAPMRPIFTFGVAVCSSLVGFFYLQEILNMQGPNLLYCIPFGLAGLIVAQMLIQKTLHVKKIVPHIALYLCAALIFFSVFHFDLTGAEHRVPKVESVESVSFDDARFTDARDIEHIIKLHKYLIDNRGESGRSIIITYTFKDKQTLEREYCIDTTSGDLLAPIYESDVMRKKAFAVLDDAATEYTNINIRDDRMNTSIDYYPNQPLEVNALLDALRRDCAAVPYEDVMNVQNAFTHINISYNVPKESPQDNGERLDTYTISPNFKNTLALLNSLGFFNTLPTAADIESAEVTCYYSDENGSGCVTYDDKDDIAALYGAFAENYAHVWQENSGSVEFYTGGRSFSVPIGKEDIENLPPDAKNLFKGVVK